VAPHTFEKKKQFLIKFKHNSSSAAHSLNRQIGSVILVLYFENQLNT
jgi:hypothetical protein